MVGRREGVHLKDIQEAKTWVETRQVMVARNLAALNIAMKGNSMDPAEGFENALGELGASWFEGGGEAYFQALERGQISKAQFRRAQSIVRMAAIFQMVEETDAALADLTAAYLKKSPLRERGKGYVQ